MKEKETSELAPLLPFPVTSLRSVAENLDLCRLMLDHLTIVPNDKVWNLMDAYRALGCTIGTSSEEIRCEGHTLEDLKG